MIHDYLSNDTSLTIEEFQKMLKDDELRIANLKSGRYFVHRNGSVVSMTTAFPRYISPIRKVTGEFFIILYTPQLKAYDLAQLVLSTFHRKKEKNVDYIFKNDDMSDCSVVNLTWIDKDKADKSRRHASHKYIQMQIDATSSDKESISTEPSNQNHGYFELPVAVVDDCIPNNKNLRRLMDNFCASLNSHLHKHYVDEDDHYLIRTTVTSLEHMVNLLDLPIHALRHIVSTPPKAHAAKIIYEHAEYRLKGLLDA